MAVHRTSLVSLGLPEAPSSPLELPVAPMLPSEVAPVDRKAIIADASRVPRASSYTIYVDFEGNPEEMLLVHGYTGAYDKVSRRVATYLRSLEAGPAPKPLYGAWTPEPAIDNAVPPPSDEVIAKLKKRGYLTTMTVAEEQSFFAQLAAQRHLSSVRSPPGYILMPTYQCNLRCPYCFQDHMRTQPAFRHLLRTVTPEMVDRIFAGMAQIDRVHGLAEDSNSLRTLVLFGGEPLLRESHDVIAYILKKTSMWKRVSISAITNGTELDAYRDLLGPNGISALQITIDGPPAEHDKRRIYPDGSGSFEQIARNIDMALELGVQISVRMNIDRNNIKMIPELAEEFTQRGWTTHRGFSSYVAPVHAGNEHTEAKTTFNSWQLNKAMEELREEHPGVKRIVSPDDSLLDRARTVLDQQRDPMPWFKSSFCGAHTTMYVVDAFGDLYACWERTGDKKIRIGEIAANGEVKMSRPILENWRSRSVVSNPVCRTCRYASYCGGGCAVLAEGQSGNIHSNFCDGFAKRFRASVATAYVEHVNKVERATISERICDL